jgi:hypothetical protein
MKEISEKRLGIRTLSRISEEELEERRMSENKRISADINETSEQPRAVLVRLAPEIATRVETDARVITESCGSDACMKKAAYPSA